MFDHCGVDHSGLNHAIPINKLLGAVIVVVEIESVASFRLLKVVQPIITSTHWGGVSVRGVLS